MKITDRRGVREKPALLQPKGYEKETTRLEISRAAG
jgi:hypothetical protein